MSEIINFDYEGQSISFEFADGNRMINATQMARPFRGKGTTSGNIVVPGRKLNIPQ